MCGKACSRTSRTDKPAVDMKPEDFDDKIKQTKVFIERTEKLIAQNDQAIDDLLLEDGNDERRQKQKQDNYAKIGVQLEQKLKDLQDQLSAFEQAKIKTIGGDQLEHQAQLVRLNQQRNAKDMVAKDKMKKDLEILKNQKEIHDELDKEINSKIGKIEESDKLRADQLLKERRAKLQKQNSQNKGSTAFEESKILQSQPTQTNTWGKSLPQQSIPKVEAVEPKGTKSDLPAHDSNSKPGNPTSPQKPQPKSAFEMLLDL